MNGYEGTGRALSLKLINQLRVESATSSTGSEEQVRRKRIGVVPVKGLCLPALVSKENGVTYSELVPALSRI